MASTSASARAFTSPTRASAVAELRLQLRLDAAAVGVDLGLRRVARLLPDRVRVLPRLGERLLVRRDRRVGVFLQPRRLRRDRRRSGCRAPPGSTPIARQRHTAHQQVEQPEADREPEELRPEGRRVEGREACCARRRAPRSPSCATVARSAAALRPALVRRLLREGRRRRSSMPPRTASEAAGSR